MALAKKKFVAFKPAGVVDWTEVATEELKGADPWQKLRHSVQGIEILPYYSKNNTQPPPSPPIAEKNFIARWFNCPLVRVESEKLSNATALDHLNHGADGIFFEVDGNTDFKTLLNGIDGRYCSLNFLAKKDSGAAGANLSTYLKQKGETEALINGAFFGNRTLTDDFPEKFHGSGFHVPREESPASEITAFYEFLTKNLSSSPMRWAVSTELDRDFFISIAKLRALRVVWGKFSDAKRIQTPLLIHARVQTWIHPQFDPNANMLSNTTAGMAAIIGGCDLLTLSPELEENKMMVRVARNVSNILREESHLSHVADPLAGSWFVEELTRQIANPVLKSLKLL